MTMLMKYSVKLETNGQIFLTVLKPIMNIHGRTIFGEEELYIRRVWCAGVILHFGLILGTEGSFEYSYTMHSGVKIIVTQKNNVCFMHGDTFRNGLLIGFKIPL